MVLGRSACLFPLSTLFPRDFACAGEAFLALCRNRAIGDSGFATSVFFSPRFGAAARGETPGDISGPSSNTLTATLFQHTVYALATVRGDSGGFWRKNAGRPELVPEVCGRLDSSCGRCWLDEAVRIRGRGVMSTCEVCDKCYGHHDGTCSVFFRKRTVSRLCCRCLCPSRIFCHGVLSSSMISSTSSRLACMSGYSTSLCSPHSLTRGFEVASWAFNVARSEILRGAARASKAARTWWKKTRQASRTETSGPKDHAPCRWCQPQPLPPISETRSLQPTWGDGELSVQG